jgi:putative transposase
MGLAAISQIAIGAEGSLVQLPGYGLIRVFKIVARDGDIEYWATNDLQMSELTRIKYANYAWTIENYHRGIKQFCNLERAQVRAGRAQRNHIGLALRAFLRLEVHCYHKGISWFEAKTSIIREAVRSYLAKPLYTLNPTA